jgi:hypothetical protein
VGGDAGTSPALSAVRTQQNAANRLCITAQEQETIDMRIAITMRSFEAASAQAARALQDDPPADCFAEFQVEEVAAVEEPVEVGDDTDETVQVTVVLRGRRDELENPALSMTDVILGALRSHRAGNSNGRARQIIDAMGIAVESAC